MIILVLWHRFLEPSLFREGQFVGDILITNRGDPFHVFVLSSRISYLAHGCGGYRRTCNDSWAECVRCSNGAFSIPSGVFAFFQWTIYRVVF